MNWKPSFAIILFSITLVTFFGGLVLDGENKDAKRKRLVWLLVLIGLMPLLVTKYYNFLNECLSDCLATLGLKFALPGLNWAVPVGISFFTFQAVGYMLDVYHGRVTAEKNLCDYILFISFFPQITSGPISIAEELLPQIKAAHKFDYNQAKQGLRYFLWGLFIKSVIADRLGIFVDTVYSNYEHYSGSTCLVASVLYTLQIYCDFAGYSLIAIGVARTLGFNLIDNFRRPYFAISISDFWKRWHISLTRWLTRQVYIPLGGNRHGRLRTYCNIFVTFLVSGIWHGANLTFIVWGALHGFFQIIEKVFGWQRYEGKRWWLRVLRISFTFILVNFAWVFFRSPNVDTAISFIGRIITDFGTPRLTEMGTAGIVVNFFAISLLLFKEFHEEFSPHSLSLLMVKPVRWGIYIFVFCMILLFGALDGGQFIYVNF